MSTITAIREADSGTGASHEIAEVVHRAATTSVRCQCGHWFQAAHRRNAEERHREHAFRSMVTAMQTAGISR